MRRLTKEDLLEGANRRERISIKDHDGEVEIRPLNDGELSKIFAIIGPVPIGPEGAPDTAQIEIHKNFEALRLATSMGMTEPKMSIEEVGQMKFGIPEYVGMKVLEMSGVAPPEIAKKKGVK